MKQLAKLEVVRQAIKMGADVFASISGGKDGQAMSIELYNNNVPVKALLHCDLGRVEWKQSHQMCEKSAEDIGVELLTLRRRDGKCLMTRWKDRMIQLAGTGKPFWSSAKARYCTSDLKREPSNHFFRTCGNNLIISAEGIRAGESKERRRKNPLSVRKEVSSSYYKNMTAEEALAKYNPNKRLVLTWFPIFDYTLEEVWMTYGMDSNMLKLARRVYQEEGVVPEWWAFHPAYVFGNDRVSCMICVLATRNDIQNGINHNPELYFEMLELEVESQSSFRMDISLVDFKVQKTPCAA